jgi:indole-3-glycerol phosphate synthase
MNKYLENIIRHKRNEVEERKALYPVRLLEKSIYFPTQPVSMKAYLRRPDKSGVIAEFKRKSPSKGWIRQFANPAEITLGYMQSGASALSVLTDNYFFAGSFDDLRAARNENYCPILQKDFIVDAYQVIEAKSNGADAVLLIAAVLTKTEVKLLSNTARELGLETLVEIHSEKELHKIPHGADLIGINNRDLLTFEVDIENSERLLNQLPQQVVKIAESGISNAEDGAKLIRMGFDGLLIGELFMASSDPVLACKRFIKKMESIIEAG